MVGINANKNTNKFMFIRAIRGKVKNFAKRKYNRTRNTQIYIISHQY